MTHDHDTPHDKYVRILNDREPPMKGAARNPNVRPKAAATLIIVDRTGLAPKLLMGRRNKAVKFLPGKFVFPGGGIEPGDARMPAAGALPTHVETRLLKHRPGGTSQRARAIALAGIRETFEETGFMIGARDFGTPDNAPAGTWSEFAAQGVYPLLEELHLIGRAITPPGRIRRYDAAFFAIDAAHIVGQVDRKIGPDSELVELAWVGLVEAMNLELPLITKIILHELEDRLAADMRPYKPVPFYAQLHGKWHRREL